MIEKKYFNGLMNGDDAQELVQPNEYINAINVRFGSSDGGKTGWFENVNSNELISNSLPVGTNTCIGSCVDEAEEVIIFFNKNSNGDHGIYAFFGRTSQIKTVLLNDDVTGGLGFNNLIQSFVINDQVFWVDGNNEYRRVNYRAAIKSYDGTFVYDYSYTLPIEQSVINVIRRPPNHALQTLKEANGLDANFIQDEAFKLNYFYTFKDGEESVMGPWTQLVDYNFDGDTFDTINIKLPFEESIEQDVQKINIVVRYEASNKCFIIKTFDRDVYSSEIADHNSGVAQIELDFYNNQNGIALNDAFSVKPFDSVPLAPKTIENARNRNFVGNYTKGYDSPKETSLSLSIPSSATVTGRWFRLEYRTGGGGTAIKYVIDITGIGASYDGYYEDPSVTGPSFPASVNFVSLTFRGAGFIAMLAAYGITTADVISFSFQSATSTVAGAPVSSYTGTALIKSDASYQAGVVFFDDPRRKSGVVTNDSLRVSTPDRDYTNMSIITGINWTLSNTNALTEIPSWATHYAIVSTKCLRTDYFIQMRTDKAIYVTKDASGNYVFGTVSAYSSSNAGVAISIKDLTSYNIGYNFSEGDICKVYIGTSVYQLAIVAQEGNWIVCQNKDIGVLNIDTVKYEIYTPKKGSTQELFYEYGEVYNINDAGTSSRTYSTLAGTIPGDVWAINRTFSGVAYAVEVMSPNDKFFSNWFTDSGNVNIIDTIGSQNKEGFFCYSNKYIPGTNSNGLCTFDALDEVNLPLECGALNKLQLTSKTQDDGTVMLAICQYETASIYLGESQLVSNTGNSFVAKSDGVVGTINVLKGSFGTSHPESVAFLRGIVMWWDAFNGQVIQYSSNGLFPVSDYKMSTVFGNMGKRYIGSSANFFGGFDPLHGEYLLSSSFTVESQGTYPSGPAKKLKVLDSNPFTIAFKNGADKWVTKYDFIPENFVYLGNRLFTFKNGQLWRHGASGYNNFYGTQYDTVISFVSNQDPSLVKTYLNMSVEGNRAPNVYIYSSYPREQYSTIEAAEFENKEGVFYSHLRRDLLSENVPASRALLAGERMRASAMYFQLHFTGSSKLELRFINIDYNPSLGHKTNP